MGDLQFAEVVSDEEYEACRPPSSVWRYYAEREPIPEDDRQDLEMTPEEYYERYMTETAKIMHRLKVHSLEDSDRIFRQYNLEIGFRMLGLTPPEEGFLE